MPLMFAVVDGLQKDYHAVIGFFKVHRVRYWNAWELIAIV